jgi:hypothetical protein
MAHHYKLGGRDPGIRRGHLQGQVYLNTNQYRERISEELSAFDDKMLKNYSGVTNNSRGTGIIGVLK